MSESPEEVVTVPRALAGKIRVSVSNVASITITAEGSETCTLLSIETAIEFADWLKKRCLAAIGRAE